MSLKGKRIVITGASSGIGRALAIEAVRRGANVCAGARNVEALAELVQQCGQTTLITHQLDVADKESCEAFIAFAAKQMGGIDVLINNAGISMRANFVELDVSVLERVMQVNFWGAVYCTHAAMTYLLKSKGSVVGVSSVAGFNGLPGRTGYSASKFALQGFLEALRTENLKTGLHVMIACPGFTASNIRNTALNAEGKVQNESPRNENKMMSSSAVASGILDGIDRRRNILVMTTQGKLSYWLSKFAPRLLSRLTYKVMKSEPNAPF
ncbi:MAG: SDR family oxidoreductase [Bacteroidia bacterium]|nr:SDR family oxidoreductase [Bacteroidia bacterium]MCO5254647.1 SDR family oxidoreductase [Bacteroidota bacterium]